MNEKQAYMYHIPDYEQQLKDLAKNQRDFVNKYNEHNTHRHNINVIRRMGVNYVVKQIPFRLDSMIYNLKHYIKTNNEEQVNDVLLKIANYCLIVRSFNGYKNNKELVEEFADLVLVR